MSFALGPTSGKKQAIIAVTVMLDYVPHLAFACIINVEICKSYVEVIN